MDEMLVRLAEQLCRLQVQVHGPVPVTADAVPDRGAEEAPAVRRTAHTGIREHGLEYPAAGGPGIDRPSGGIYLHRGDARIVEAVVQGAPGGAAVGASEHA